MTRETLRILIVAATIIAALTFLYPTYVFYFDPPKNADKLEEVKRKSISLGLDLQGGIHLVLEVNPDQVPEAQRHDVMDRVREIITNRVDQFGVSEPIIHQQGDWRIVVELAGIQDVERAKAIIDRTARLEFKILKPNADLAVLLNKADTHLAAAAGDTVKKASGGLFEEMPEEIKHSLTALFLPGYRQGDLKVSVDNLQTVRQILKEVEHLVPDDAEFLWGSKNEDVGDGQKFRRLYYLKKRVEMTGDIVKDATITTGQSFEYAGMPIINFTTTDEGVSLFRRVTGAHVGEQMAIILDSQVYSAPTIQVKIRDGRSIITGSSTLERGQRPGHCPARRRPPRRCGPR